MDSCINVNKLNAAELEVQDRACTNDDQYCVIVPMSGNVLYMQLERLCACISEHINLVSNQLFTVTHMVVNFKIDSEDRVWLLWCEHLEVSDEVCCVIHSLLIVLIPRLQKGHPLPMQVEYPRESENVSDEEDERRRDDKFSRRPSKSRTRSRDKQRKSKRRDSDEENASPYRRKHEHSESGSDEDLDLILSSAPSSVQGDLDDGFSPDFVLLPETKRSSSKTKGKKSGQTKSSKKVQERERPASESSSSVNDENVLAQENQRSVHCLPHFSPLRLSSV